MRVDCQAEAPTAGAWLVVVSSQEQTDKTSGDT